MSNRTMDPNGERETIADVTAQRIRRAASFRDGAMLSARCARDNGRGADFVAQCVAIARAHNRTLLLMRRLG